MQSRGIYCKIVGMLEEDEKEYQKYLKDWQKEIRRRCRDRMGKERDPGEMGGAGVENRRERLLWEEEN